MFEPSGYTQKEENILLLKILAGVLFVPVGIVCMLMNTFVFYFCLFCGIISLVSFIYGKIKGRF